MEKNRMKEIAIKNLKTLGVYAPAIEAFKADEKNVWCSERTPLAIAGVGKKVMGTLYDIYQSGGYTYQSECDAAIRQVREDGYLPYHVIQTNMEFGNTFAVLYVSEEADGVEHADKDDKYGFIIYAYVYNADAPELSEYGSIGVTESGGGLIRTA